MPDYKKAFNELKERIIRQLGSKSKTNISCPEDLGIKHRDSECDDRIYRCTCTSCWRTAFNVFKKEFREKRNSEKS